MSAFTEEQTSTMDQKQQEGHVETVEDNTRLSKHGVGFTFFLNALIVGCSWAMYAYDNNFTTPLVALPRFVQHYQKGKGDVLGATLFSANNLDFLSSFPLVGAAIGGFIGMPLLQKLGRKWSLQIAYVVFCTPGAIIQLCAPTIAALAIGRFWSNIGISLANTSSGLYLSEIAPVKIRAQIIGFAIIGCNAVSILAITLVWGTEKIKDDRAFKIPFAVQLAIPVFLFLITFFVVESPTFYALRGRMDEARKTLLKLRKNNPAAVEAEMIALEELAVRGRDKEKARFWDILNKDNLQRTLVGASYTSLSQVCGQVLTLTYATVLLVQSGIEDPFEITIIITVAIFLGATVGLVLLDKVGRRPIALTGFVIIFLLDISIAGLATGGLETKPERVAMAAMFIIFGFFNAFTFQSIMLLAPSELSSVTLREASFAWAVFWMYVTAIIATFVVPQLTQAANLAARADYIFAGCTLVTIVVTYFFLPETRGRSLAEIDHLYATKIPARKWPKPGTVIPETVREQPVQVVAA
ncbi:hypothetical protein HRR83_009468 [Exophiala dermatitidis]|uniref:MFS transporter, SP family, general alpha glucoside:H+ symporter n=2 Tax=Exophiala dermatitidis TaxID=5970 RepID=H6BTW0_EXODN|nr:MFS transporter, SP family, general alpha glucoside:H+ symporter [Exophiala dermatitidis NIH/UT8656]KAJ4501941.1 hypothetical protein HRR75_008775 [Exophiala dermatitidis]EHY55537.1 MFS transporter, SP family, general alpha glucoside:H+ symporter [Exophiala dermatitidis NIH/UT8656]KAJ4502571.1 hypothetical protein HRR74_009536 [Exophiala dermatitidis]KAJ4510271.1 hypothetical protein HRR73_007069 [Exophiala dermatitidis]KAJ4531510.1 hypothetical protein HRR77_009440 [Exophiala dermatitidis]